MKNFLFPILIALILGSCFQSADTQKNSSQTRMLSRTEYKDKLYGFWLGQCIANWTGLVTEMDKIGNIGAIKTGDFYTRTDWGKPDQASIWAEGVPSDLSPTIDFVFRDTNEIWGADDDTDIEYMYQHLLFVNDTSLLSPHQIQQGWLKHIKSEEENYLWVSNQRAFDLMKEGVLPPVTGTAEKNEHFDMIDAQLTTEIFGLFAPGNMNVALTLADLPIRTVASGPAEEIAKFYVAMYAQSGQLKDLDEIGQSVRHMADKASLILTKKDYPYLMYVYVKQLYDSGISWESARDSVYIRYQFRGEDGYDITARDLYCNGCFAAGINFAASLVSLFYGNGDIVETIKMGVLMGWDSDNPTATWGGMLGFILGRKGVEEAFGRKFSNRFNIHRTRQNFPGDGVDTFEDMAAKGMAITEKVIHDFSLNITIKE